MSKKKTKFNRYEFDYVGYAMEFEFLDSQEQERLMYIFQSCWKKYGPKKIQKTKTNKKSK